MSKEIPPKCLALQNFRLIIRLIDEQGWILRNTVQWNKPNSMPSSVKDRLTNKYEPVFFLVKNKKYWFDLDSIREKYQDRDDIARRVRKQHLYKDYKCKGESQARSYQENKKKGQDYVPLAGKNPGDVWTIPTQPYPEAHFATFPEKLVIKPILSSCPEWICKKCGKARVRITKTEYSGNVNNTYKSERWGNQKDPTSKVMKKVNANHQTIDWTDCGCNAGWRPGITLDLFAGSGTTLAMAKRCRRQFIGYEIVKSYIPFIRKRLAKEDTMFNRDLKEQFI